MKLKGKDHESNKITFTNTTDTPVVCRLCGEHDDYYDGYVDNGVTLPQLMERYELWYVDYNATTGSGDVPFLTRAFTVSFLNGTLYANNNVAYIGSTGNGFGIGIGYYVLHPNYGWRVPRYLRLLRIGSGAIEYKSHQNDQSLP